MKAQQQLEQQRPADAAEPTDPERPATPVERMVYG
jgi:hypothetical protein